MNLRDKIISKWNKSVKNGLSDNAKRSLANMAVDAVMDKESKNSRRSLLRTTPGDFDGRQIQVHLVGDASAQGDRWAWKMLSHTSKSSSR